MSTNGITSLVSKAASMSLSLVSGIFTQLVKLPLQLEAMALVIVNLAHNTEFSFVCTTDSFSFSYRFSFFISVVPLWNSLPSTIPFASSAVTFKSHVVAYMY